MNRLRRVMFLIALASPLCAQVTTPAKALRGIAVKPTEVLVLATPHLQDIADWNPLLVRRLNDALVRWRPAMIIVEQIPPGEIESGLHDDERREIVEAFARRALKLGADAQRHLGIDATAAQKKAAAMISEDLSGTSRGELVKALVAGYDLPSAVLVWKQLTPEARNSLSELKEITAGLDELAASQNEVYSVAVPVALESGLRHLESADDHIDDVKLSRLSPEEIHPLIVHPLYKTATDAAVYATSKKRLQDAVRRGDLLPYYLYVNSRQYQDADIAAQWGVFLRMNLPSGVDRYRYALWEARNQAIAAKIATLIAARQPQRVLVVFGAAHKSFLETDLSHSPLIRLVQLESIIPQATERDARGTKPQAHD